MFLLAPQSDFVENLIISILRNKDLNPNLRWIIYNEFLQVKVKDLDTAWGLINKYRDRFLEESPEMFFFYLVGIIGSKVEEN